jgi:hypothetical protein
MPPPLFLASVPVFRDYLGRTARLADAAGPELLARAVIADAAPAGRQFAMAAGFALRGTCPLAGREIPDLPVALAPRLAVARAMLGAMLPAEFIGAEDRRVRHRAGDATLDQPAADYLHGFAIPNFFFHMTMGYAALRAAGMPLGKADFDGLHLYRPVAEPG